MRVHPTNPRYFANTSGKAIYLGGHQIFTDLQDRVGADILGGQRVGNESRLDWESYLSFLASRNINYIRNWTEFSLGPSPAGSLPLPYERVAGFGNANDGQLKVDLNRFNQVFFDRTRSRAIDLGKRRIYISFMLFDVYGFSNFAGENGASLFNAANNINGVNADLNGDGWGVEFFMEPTAEICRLQQNYAKKVVDTIGDLDNVFIEISNEAGNIAWHYDMINFIRSYMTRQRKNLPVLLSPGGLSGGCTTCYSGSHESAYATSGADTYSVERSWADYLNNPPPNNSGRPLIMDMDHIEARNNDRRVPWKAFTRGYHFTLYDLPFENPEAEDSTWDNARHNIGAINRYAQKMNLAATTPRGDLTSTSFALVNPGSDYLIYQPSGGTFTVDLQNGTYDYEWFNPATAAIAGSGTISSAGGSQLFQPPFGGDAVLYLTGSSRQYPR